MEEDSIQQIERSRRQEERSNLQKLLKLNFKKSEEIWYNLKQMQKELGLPSLYPIKDHYYYYKKLEETRIALNIPERDFIQLDQILIEITILRDRLKLPVTTPISKVISLIRGKSIEEIAVLGVKYDSLFLKSILLYSYSNQSKKGEEKEVEYPTIDKDLDRVLFEILTSYGPLSRPELVKITGIARSSIYDSLQRLSQKGYIVQYVEKRSNPGRPTTVFDSAI